MNYPEFLGRGWSFPPTFDSHSKSVEMTEFADDIKKSLEILISTKLGERIMQPEYGASMTDYQFETLNLTSESRMIDMLTVAILLHEPRIRVSRINLNRANELEGRVLIEIEYSIKATNSRANYVYPFYINEGSNLG